MLLNYISPLSLVILILSMSITNTFLDSIPSIFLGAPEPSTSLSILPGHKLLMEGKGFEAVILTLIGSSISLIVAMLSFPIAYKGLIVVYPTIQKYIPYMLIIISLVLVLKEKKSRMWALIFFLSSGILGIASFSMNIKDVLFPLLSGLFGVSTLLTSLNNKVKIPKQIQTYPEIKNSEKIKIFSAVFLSSLLTTTLPGLGAAQAAAISSTMFKDIKNKSFLVLVGGINTSGMVLSIFTLYAIDKARNGSIVAISQVFPEININHLLIFLGISLVSSSLAIILTINIAKNVSKIITKVNYKFLGISVILFVTILVFILSGNFLGLLILITSTFLGILPQLKNTTRSHLMGCIILPVILYFI